MAVAVEKRGNLSAARPVRERGGRLRREIGVFGLLFTSVGSIIGSGWLFGALYASQIAGPAALISWVIGGVSCSCSRSCTPSSARCTRSPAARRASRTTRSAASPASRAAGSPSSAR